MKQAMEEQQERYERIEQYLAGLLETGDRLAFEAELQQDATLAEEVELHRQLEAAIQQESHDTIVEQALNKAEADYFMDRPSEGKVIPMLNSQSRWYWLAASLSLALLIGIGLYLLPVNAPSDHALFAENFSVYEAPVIFRSEEKNEDSTLQRAFVAYNQKAYLNALTYFTKSLQENPRQIVPQFYIGQCKLALNDPEEAISYFQQVIDQGDNAYIRQATWYLALAYLDAGQEQRAIPLFQEIGHQGGPFQERATNILQELTETK